MPVSRKRPKVSDTNPEDHGDVLSLFEDNDNDNVNADNFDETDCVNEIHSLAEIEYEEEKLSDPIPDKLANIVNNRW